MPLIKNKIVAVYHCKEVQEAFNPLASEIQIFPITWTHTSSVPRGEKVGVPAQKEKEPPVTAPPRELALTEASYKVRQKPENGS